MLSEEYIHAAMCRARQYSGAYTGTCGTLAADVIRLIRERETMSSTITKLQEANDKLRDAVQSSRDASGETASIDAAHAACDYEAEQCNDFIAKASIQLREARLASSPDSSLRFPGDGLLTDHSDGGLGKLVNLASGPIRAGSQQFIEVLVEAAELHLKKTLDYGTEEDALSNIRDGARLINVEPWKACLVRIADKMSRMKSFCRRGKVEFDGVEDTFIDIINYAAIALTEYRNERSR